MSPPDLRMVDELCRLALAARRLGCRIQVVDPDPELRSLIRQAGVGDLLLGDASETGPEEAP